MLGKISCVTVLMGILQTGVCLREKQRDVGLHSTEVTGFLFSSFTYNYLINTTFGPNEDASHRMSGTVVVSPLRYEALEEDEPVTNDTCVSIPKSVTYLVELEKNSQWGEELCRHPFIFAFESSPSKLTLNFHPDDTVSSRNFKLGLARTIVPLSISRSKTDLAQCTLDRVNFCDAKAGNATDWEEKCTELLSFSPDISSNPLSSGFLYSTTKQRTHIGQKNIMDTSVTMEWQRLFLSTAVSANNTVLEIMTTKVLALKKISLNNHSGMTDEKFKELLAKYPAVRGPTPKPETEGILAKDAESPSVSKRPLKELLQKLRKHTLKSSAATPGSARAFLAAISSVQSAIKSEIIEILKEVTTKKKKNSSVYFVLDILATSSSVDAFEAVHETLDLKKADHRELFQRYVMALSYALHPNLQIAQKLLTMLDEKNLDKKLQEAIALALGAAGKRMTGKGEVSHELTKTHQTIGAALIRGLEKCAEVSLTDRGECESVWLRALGNYGSRRMVPVLIDGIRGGGTASATAIRSLYGLFWKNVNDEVEEAVWDALEGPKSKFNSDTKVAAIDWFCKYFTESGIRVQDDQIERFVMSVLSIAHKESRAYGLSRLENTPVLRSVLGTCWNSAKCSKRLSAAFLGVGGYGQSLAYQGNLAAHKAINASYDLAMQFAAGSMKTSSVKVILNSFNNTLEVISFGLYSHGLTSFMGGSDSGDDEPDNEVTAGLVLNMMDVALPKIVFFNGLGQLTSMAMSASGDDPVAEMQFNLMAQKEEKIFPLNNGLFVKWSLERAVAAELAGYIDISLWYRTSKSIVRNRAAVAARVTADLYFENTRVSNATVTENAQGKMDFVTNVDFSGFPIKLCMQMSSSTIKSSRYRKSLHEGKKGNDKKTIRKSWRRSSPPVSFAFGRRNAQSCRALM